jgi:hypothetical protein
VARLNRRAGHPAGDAMRIPGPVSSCDSLVGTAHTNRGRAQCLRRLKMARCPLRLAAASSERLGSGGDTNRLTARQKQRTEKRKYVHYANRISLFGCTNTASSAETTGGNAMRYGSPQPERTRCLGRQGLLGIMAPHSKRRLRAYSQTWCSSFSPKPLSAVELASDRSIRRNASQVGEQFHVTRHRRDSGCTQRGTRVMGGSAAPASETLRGPA